MANYRTPELAARYGGGGEVVEVTLSNGRTAYTTAPTNRYVSSTGAPVETEEERERRAREGSAGANVSSLLRQYGLDELIPMVDTWVRQGMSWPEIEGQLMDVATPAGKVVDRLYPEIRLRRDAGRAPVSIADIQNYRTRVREMMGAAGMPEGFYDTADDFSRFIVGDVSLTELQSRLQDGFVAAQAAPQEVRDELERVYGIGPGGLAAYWIDPDRALPALERSLETARIGGAAQRTGFGNLTRVEGERLAALGVGEQQAQEGFGFLSSADEIVNPLVGTTEDEISREEQLGAVFEGNANAQRRIQRRQRSRTAAFQSGGGFATGDDGFAGVGRAR